MPTHIQHPDFIGTKALPKSANLPARTELLDNYILFFEINLYFSGK